MTDKEKIIKAIEKEAQKQGLSESALAKKAGLGQKRVNNLLGGKTKRLDSAVVDKLCGVLGIVAEPGEEYPTSQPIFRVVKEIVPEKEQARGPISTAFLVFFEALPIEEQMAELQRMQAKFIASQSKEKP